MCTPFVDSGIEEKQTPLYLPRSVKSWPPENEGPIHIEKNLVFTFYLFLRNLLRKPNCKRKIKTVFHKKELIWVSQSAKSQHAQIYSYKISYIVTGPLENYFKQYNKKIMLCILQKKIMLHIMNHLK